MTQIEYRIKIGQDEFTLKVEAANELEFFEKLSFYSNLPKTGPNGETDLKLSFKLTKENYKYYSLVSEQAGQEYRFGLVNDKNGGLFPKGWHPLYSAGQEAQGPVAGAQPVVSAPIVAAPVSAPKVAKTSVINPVIKPGVSIPSQVPTPAAPIPAPSAAASATLARFGLKS